MRDRLLAHITDLSRGFDAGNFASAYETEDFPAEHWEEFKSEEYAAGFIVGFFSSYEWETEIPHEWREKYLAARARFAWLAEQAGIAWE